LARRLSLDIGRLTLARNDLITLDMIAFDPPLYQVLSLEPPVPVVIQLERLHAILGGRP